MRIFKLSDYTRGWIIGDFDPAIIKTKDFEVKVVTYPPGFIDKDHVHNMMDEISIIASGSCRVQDHVFSKGDIYWIERGEWVDFEALEECTLTVVKLPSVKGDKYYKT